MNTDNDMNTDNETSMMNSDRKKFDNLNIINVAHVLNQTVMKDIELICAFVRTVRSLMTYIRTTKSLLMCKRN
jgi:hypothetical protein